ncbi:GspE/PulE family protein [Wansuia hejianensis]|uniref:Type II/IV secretion system protein n=1 Tax=Wansuia hejianensis TaxID=2763667 RepID=A0A926EVJ1_9FIRM|nr:GspE/PulE family protein [Wansuia hejianensis]MBC8590658.1 type II/IV secretion system protein [Wansuia hejianensis]
MKKINLNKFKNHKFIEKLSNEESKDELTNLNTGTNNDIIAESEYQQSYPKIDLSLYKLNNNLINIIPESIVRKHKIIPIDKEDNTLVVAMAEPIDFFAIDDIKLFTNMNLKLVLASKEDIIQLINRLYSIEPTKKILSEIGEDNLANEYDRPELIEVSTDSTVRLLNSIIEQAVRSMASDIHIEPFSENIRIRIRIDGDLQEIMSISKGNLSSIITRIKIIGKMNIAEYRIPQDGHVQTIINGREIDMRISTIPTIYGEKAVIRLLDKETLKLTKESLILNKKNLKTFNRILAQPYGIILVTGPSGSGKTTTLYTIIRELYSIERNIITIEDPVEYKIEGINQIQINTKSGLTFASGLRSILRQDPDIIMVGEIRDNKTAEIAVRAAITGHLVISTLHTNDSPSTVARLVDMGIEPYLLSSAIIGVISQRLVKLLCNDCKKPYKANSYEKKALNVREDKDLILYKPSGCNTCNHGYKGRVAIHEIMPIDGELRKYISLNNSVEVIRSHAVKKGMRPLFKEASDLVLTGNTSFPDFLKIGLTLDNM